MSNQVVQQIDLGLRVLGVDQCEYAVNGVRGKTFGQAVGLASIHRATSLEKGINGYAAIIRTREKKIEDLSNMLSVLSATRAQYDAATGKTGAPGYDDDRFTVNLEGGHYGWYTAEDFAAALQSYGVSLCGWAGTGEISAAKVDKIKSDVEYKMQTESTDLQSDLMSLQSYMSKRDSAFSTASQMQRKCDKSVSAQLKYITGA